MARQLVDLDTGGTAADLHLTGGDYQVLRQDTPGAPVTVGSVPYDPMQVPIQPGVTNNTAVTMPPLSVVYVSGFLGLDYYDVRLAQADALATADALGILATAMADSGFTRCITRGQYTYGSNSVWQAAVDGNAGSGLTVGDELWLSAANAGKMRVGPPMIPGQIMTYIGRCIGPNTLFVDVQRVGTR
jgi:hypothetical protein